MNIGILGGSFDPIHNGHLHMAKCAYESYALYQVWLIPAGHSPNKDEHGMTDAKDRFQMCKLAAQPYPWMTVSRLELDSAERSYTYRTMEKLSEQFPMHRFFFIMGGDSLDYFEQWKQPERIAKLATILVIPRDLFSISFVFLLVPYVLLHFFTIDTDDACEYTQILLPETHVPDVLLSSVPGGSLWNTSKNVHRERSGYHREIVPATNGSSSPVQRW